MFILIALGSAIVLLFFWLLGGQFARVLVFLLLLPTLGVTVSAIAQGNLELAIFKDAAGQFGFAIGLLLAWPVANLPTYFRQQRMNRLRGVSMVRYRDQG